MAAHEDNPSDEKKENNTQERDDVRARAGAVHDIVREVAEEFIEGNVVFPHPEEEPIAPVVTADQAAAIHPQITEASQVEDPSEIQQPRPEEVQEAAGIAVTPPKKDDRRRQRKRPWATKSARSVPLYMPSSTTSSGLGAEGEPFAQASGYRRPRGQRRRTSEPTMSTSSSSSSGEIFYSADSGEEGSSVYRSVGDGESPLRASTRTRSVSLPLAAGAVNEVGRMLRLLSDEFLDQMAVRRRAVPSKRRHTLSDASYFMDRDENGRLYDPGDIVSNYPEFRPGSGVLAGGAGDWSRGNDEIYSEDEWSLDDLDYSDEEDDDEDIRNEQVVHPNVDILESEESEECWDEELVMSENEEQDAPNEDAHLDYWDDDFMY